MNKQPILSLLSVLATALLLGSLTLAEEPEKPAPREIRQGGYVEKVDPNVDYKARLPRIAPREPAESLAGMHVVPGFRIELAAAEPLVVDAVDLAFDEDGRMFVAEMIPYAEGNTSKYGSPGGRVSVLEDTDGDGTFDRRSVLVDRLVWPTGVLCYDGGVFIAAAPDLLYCKDTDGDGRADVREVVVTGFELSNPNALPNSLRWGLDSRIHGMTSTAGGMLVPVRFNAAVDDPANKVAAVQARGRDFSIDPRTGEMRLESGGSQHGMALDAWGRKFESSNSTPIEMVMYDDRYLARNAMLAAPAPRERIWTHGMVVYPTAPPEPWRVVRTEMRIGGVFSGPVEGGGKPGGYFTAACGLTIYTGDAWPEAYRGDALVCEGAGNLVHRMKLEPRGVGFSAHRTEPGHEFWTSDEIWFRPIQFANAPDGTLYLADMYREIFEHPDAVPPSVKKHISLTAGNDRGRIYRIVHEGFQRRPPVRLSQLPTSQLVALLKHANGWHRQTAARLLYQKQDPAAVDPLVALAAESESPLGRMHAMWALAGQNALSPEVVLGRLNDAHPRVREHAVRLAERVLADGPAVRERLYTTAGDDDPRVRYQTAFTLGEIPTLRATVALARVAKTDVGDRWVRLAVLSSCYGRPGELFAELATDRTWRATTNGRTFLAQMAEQAGLQDQADQVAEVFKALETFAEDEKPLAEAVVAGLNRGLTKSNSPLRERLASGSAGELLAEMVARAKATAVDTKQPIETRTEAIRSLALASFEDVGGVLPELFQSRQAAAVQTAALRALGRFRDPRVAAMIVDAWVGFSPQVRGEAAEALFARRERLGVLLSAVEAESISPSQLDPARIRFLLSHPEAEIRDRATRLLGGAKLARREEVVAGYRDVLEMQADTTRGKAVFKRECATCHRLEGEGYDLGLPLATVQSRGREGILVQILDPNREVNPAYLNYVAVTDDGRSLTGMIAAETATSITLRRAEGESDTVLRGDIDELQSTSLSIMPEGLEEKLPRRDMADLIEYLMSIR